MRSSEEGEVFWMKLEDFRKAELARDMADMLDIFLHDNKGEFYYYSGDNPGEWKYEIK